MICRCILPTLLVIWSAVVTAQKCNFAAPLHELSSVTLVGSINMPKQPNQFVSVRKLHKEGALQRSGAGGRPDPFKWTRTLQSQA